MTSERLTFGWGWHQARLRAAKSYWIVTTGPDGAPHAAPVWGVWSEGGLWFSTSGTSRKARNLQRDPRVVVHLDSSDDVVMIEGTAEVVTGGEALGRARHEYATKYALTDGDAADLTGVPAAPVFRVRPRLAHTWLEPAFPQTMARWRFEDGGDPVFEPNSYG